MTIIPALAVAMRLKRRSLIYRSLLNEFVAIRMVFAMILSIFEHSTSGFLERPSFLSLPPVRALSDFVHLLLSIQDALSSDRLPNALAGKEEHLHQAKRCPTQRNVRLC